MSETESLKRRANDGLPFVINLGNLIALASLIFYGGKEIDRIDGLARDVNNQRDQLLRVEAMTPDIRVLEERSKQNANTLENLNRTLDSRLARIEDKIDRVAK